MSSPRRSYQLVQQYPPKIQVAAAMGVSLFAVMFFMLFLYRRIVMAGSYVTITGKAFRPRVADVGPLRYVLLGVCLLYLLAAVGLPLVTLLYASLQKIAVAFPTAGNWTLDNFRVAMTMNAVRSALTNSLLLGFGHRDNRCRADGTARLADLSLAAARQRLDRICRDVSAGGASSGVCVRPDVGLGGFPDSDLRNAVAAAARLPHGVFCRLACALSPASCCRSTRVSRNARRCAVRLGHSGYGR